MYLADEWPQMPDGSEFDGTQLLSLARSGNSPFHRDWDINLLIREIEVKLGTKIVDILHVSMGSNYYGFHIALSNRPDIVARLSRSDVNVPGYGSFPLEVQVLEANFEAAVYEILRSEPDILASHLLYYRVPVRHDGPKLGSPEDIAGRRLFLFAKTVGENNLWDLSDEHQTCLLTHLAYIRALLFNFKLPLDFAASWLRERLVEPRPESLSSLVAPTRDFCIALLTAKLEATIKNIGDMIGWEDDNNTVGPIAVAAKQSLLRLIPYIIPVDNSSGDQTSLYRLVLEHGDYGIHNVSIATQTGSDRPLVTSLYDWETACIVPAILSDPLVAVIVDLVTDENANPSLTRVPDDEEPDQRDEYMTWSKEYFRVLFDRAPVYEYAIQAGKDVRHLWFALRDWRGDDPEDYFGELGAWAEKKLEEFKPRSEIDGGDMYS